MSNGEADAFSACDPVQMFQGLRNGFDFYFLDGQADFQVFLRHLSGLLPTCRVGADGPLIPIWLE